MTHHKQTINDLKLKLRIFYTIFFFLSVYGVVELLREPVVSPCAESGCFVKTVYAKEEKTELEQITQYIVEKFQPLGRDAAVWALGCFISESKLNPQAYNFNSNKTWDFGIAQWNQVHGQSIDEIRDWKKQINLAFDLYKKYGKKPWYGSACK